MAGRTSMEVGVRAETEDLLNGQIRHVASAYLTFVALDANGQPTPIPPLLLGDEKRIKRHRMAQARRKARLAEKNDLIIIIAYGQIDKADAASFKPAVVFVDKNNKPVKQ